MAQQKVTIEIPDEFGPEERSAIGKDIVEFIRQRSEDGVGVKETANGWRNVPFPAYSKTYKESLGFKIAGKSNKVNLTLSGDMLIALDVLNHRPGEVTIGYRKSDREENARAEGNILGSYGGSPNPKKARNFLGISKADLQEIIDQYRGDKA